MKFYAKRGNKTHAQNIKLFWDVMALNSDIKFFQPNPEHAPWHVQAVLGGVLMNFWPHLLKGNIDGTPAVTGKKALLELIGEARAMGDDDFDLLEDVERAREECPMCAGVSGAKSHHKNCQYYGVPF